MNLHSGNPEDRTPKRESVLGQSKATLPYDQARGLRRGIDDLVERLANTELDDYSDEQLAMWYEIFLPVRFTLGRRVPTEEGLQMAANPLSREEFESHLLRIIHNSPARGCYVLNRLLDTFLEENPARKAA